MDSVSTFNMNICSYNMLGYNNGLPMVQDLCETFDFILLQEHWLTSFDLQKINEIHKDFTSFSVSAMDSRIQSEIYYGRPFGGTAILCRNKYLRYCTLIDRDTSAGRLTAIRFYTKQLDIVIVKFMLTFHILRRLMTTL